MQSMRECSIEECSKPHHARGWCQMHHRRWKTHGNTETVAVGRPGGVAQDVVCRIVGCERKPKGKSLCATHYSQQYVRPYKACSHVGCEKPQASRRLCAMHVTREDRVAAGTATPERYQDVDPVEKITSNVEVGLCWLWQKKTNNRGYGVTNFDGRRWYVHRLLWTELVGPIPDVLELDHLCKQAGCCNPDHLEPVTHAENSRRSGARTAMADARRRKARPIEGAFKLHGKKTT